MKQEAKEDPVAAFVRLEWFATSMRSSVSTPRPARRLSPPSSSLDAPGKSDYSEYWSMINQGVAPCLIWPDHHDDSQRYKPSISSYMQPVQRTRCPQLRPLACESCMMASPRVAIRSERCLQQPASQSRACARAGKRRGRGAGLGEENKGTGGCRCTRVICLRVRACAHARAS